ncbi:MAG: hypothetical protein ABIR11_13620 [Candidatus Limnocylindrales bacterium]
MNRRLAAWFIGTCLAVSGCAGITDGVKPGDPMAKLCESARALAHATGLAHASIDASAAGRGVAASDFASRADIARQGGVALAGRAGDLEGYLDPAGSPGFADRVREIGEAQKAVDRLVAVLGVPAAPVTIEARPRLLAAAAEAVGAIGLPEECTVIEVPSATG